MRVDYTRRFVRSGLDYWQASSRAQRLLFVSGTLLCISMIVHGVVLVVTHGTMTGPISFRKAMTFAETGWLLCWSVGWLLPLLNFQPWERHLVVAATWFFAVDETCVMTVQVWRGVPSHYNLSGGLNTGLFASGGVGAALFLVGMLVLLAASLRRSSLAPSLLLSIRAGTVITLVGVVIGWIMISNFSGVYQGHFLTILDRPIGGHYEGPAPGTIGGDLVALHALGVHGLEMVPLAAWLLTYSRLAERDRFVITAAVAASYGALMTVLGIQVLRARPFSEIGGLLLVLVTSTAAVLAGSYLLVGWWTLQGLQGSSRRAQRGK